MKFGLIVEINELLSEGAAEGFDPSGKFVGWSLRLLATASGHKVSPGLGAIHGDVIFFKNELEARAAVKKAGMDGFRFATPAEFKLLKANGFGIRLKEEVVVHDMGDGLKAYSILKDSSWHKNAYKEVPKDAWSIGKFVTLHRQDRRQD
jgi:hypothetical protein